MNHSINITRLKSVYHLLTDLDKNYVFVGGAVVSLYVDRAAEESRPTEDVDVLLEIYSTIEYNQVEEKLRDLGFQNDITAKFVGRYIHNGIIIDFMPLKDEVLGFSNKWYEEAFQNAVEIALDTEVVIKIFSAPYFIATKLEAFKSRGKNNKGEYDGRLSADFEDIVYILVNRDIIWDELKQANDPVKQYLVAEFSSLLQNQHIREWIDVHSDHGSEQAEKYVLPQMNKFVNNK